MGRNPWFTVENRTSFEGRDPAKSHPILRLRLLNTITQAHVRQACARITAEEKITTGIIPGTRRNPVVEIRVEAASCNDARVEEILEDIKATLSLMINNVDTISERRARLAASRKEAERTRTERPPYVNDPLLR